jgi:hypothetical protein
MKTALFAIAIAVCLLAAAVAYHGYQLNDRTTTVKHVSKPKPDAGIHWGNDDDDIQLGGDDDNQLGGE